MAVENTRLRVAKHRQLGRLAFFEGKPVSSPPLPFCFCVCHSVRLAWVLFSRRTLSIVNAFPRSFQARWTYRLLQDPLSGLIISYRSSFKFYTVFYLVIGSLKPLKFFKFVNMDKFKIWRNTDFFNYSIRFVSIDCHIYCWIVKNSNQLSFMIIWKLKCFNGFSRPRRARICFFLSLSQVR